MVNRLLVSLSIIVLFSSACREPLVSSVDAELENDLVGTWILIATIPDTPGEIQLTFREDLSMHVYNKSATNPPVVREEEWQFFVDDKQIVMFREEIGINGQPYIQYDYFPIKSLTRTQLVFVNLERIEQTYSRN